MDALGWPFLFFVWLMGGKGSGSSSPAAAPPERRWRRRRPLPAPSSPAPSAQTPPGNALPAATAPWPQVVPAGLPPFPGSGWEYDDPPPAAVVQRAKQLLKKLWEGGRGTYLIEQTAGRWIAYQAAPTSVPRGVVAFREKRTRTAPAGPASTASLPSSTSSPAILIANVPAPAGARLVRLERGGTYRFKAVAVRSSKPLTKALLDELAGGLKKGGATDLTMRVGPPASWDYTLQSQIDNTLPLDTPITIRAADSDGDSWELVFKFTSIVEVGMTVLAPAAPSSALPAPQGGAVHLQTLRYPMGAKPAEPLDDVRLLQRRLGIEADGRFWSGTLKAVKAFQKKNGLVQDGVVGPKTWAKLLAADAVRS